MRSFTKFAAVLVLVAACGEGPLEPGAFTLDGSWLGRAFPYEMALELDQAGDNSVTGTGELRFLQELLDTDTTVVDSVVSVDTVLIDTTVVRTVPLEVSGDWDYPDFVLTLSSGEYADVEYAGRFGTTSPDSVGGTLRESGFNGTTLPLVRQP
jgi:hypothetical protein